MKRSRKALIALLILLGLMVLGYNFYHFMEDKDMRQVLIEDASRRSRFLLEADPSLQNVFKLRLRITGELEGKAVIRMSPPGNEVLVRKVIMGGKVDTEYEGDWYALDCELLYEPELGSTGNLKISYLFVGPE